MDRRFRIVAFLAFLWVAGACSAAGEDAPADSLPPPSASTSTTSAPTPAAEPALPRVEEYRAGLDANLFLPSAPDDPAPVVVMVPGGAWRTADPSGYADLAASFAEAGAVAVTIEVSAAEDGSVYPEPVDDVRCAVSYAIDAAVESDIEPGQVVVVGHSSGAHLAALAALGEDGSAPDCGTAEIDALVGLAGVYDVDRLPALAYLLFGVTPEEDPETWREGNPLLQAGRRPELPVLLLHGEADRLVPRTFTDDFSAVLAEAGHRTDVSIVSGADHQDIITADFVGDEILTWIERLPGDGDV